MVDPLAEFVALLRPGAPIAKTVRGADCARMGYPQTGLPFFCAALEGTCRVDVEGRETMVVHQGDFVLIPSGVAFRLLDPAGTPLIGTRRAGETIGPAELRLLAGYCIFGSPDAALLVSFLPQVVHVRGGNRLAKLVRLIEDETCTAGPASDAVLRRLLEVLFIEALRCAVDASASPGLLQGIADARIAAALQRMHAFPARPWTVAQLAKDAALSRSAFFERFSRIVGVTPMKYLLAWRMAIAMDLLLRNAGGVADVAERVGYGTASAFSAAFARYVGMSPTHYLRKQAETRLRVRSTVPLQCAAAEDVRHPARAAPRIGLPAYADTSEAVYAWTPVSMR
ncbi:AraC family transcriptional regulator [Paraburkholderia pallida]|uniref:AraC family transcriptional regulator n=1 Tax=Paraburkholderia pallida TaxID=2547399 RepID=A0A4P7CU63_9BURK|nr:AraC family transcriptional regulator [Paraburkholderia pallida]